MTASSDYTRPSPTSRLLLQDSLSLVQFLRPADPHSAPISNSVLLLPMPPAVFQIVARWNLRQAPTSEQTNSGLKGLSKPAGIYMFQDQFMFQGSGGVVCYSFWPGSLGLAGDQTHSERLGSTGQLDFVMTIQILFTGPLYARQLD